MSDEEKGRKLQEACTQGRTKEAQRLIKDPSTAINWDNHGQQLSPFFLSCAGNQTALVKALLARDDLLANMRGSNGALPFSAACQSGYFEIVKTLAADARVDVNKEDKDGSSPLFLACFFGRLEVAKFLLSDPRVDVGKENFDGLFPLWIACHEGYKELVEVMLLRSSDLDVNAVSKWDNTTPMQQAMEQEHYEIATLLQRYDQYSCKTCFELRRQFKWDGFFFFSLQNTSKQCMALIFENRGYLRPDASLL